MRKTLCKAFGMLIAINAKLRETSLHQQPLCQSQRSARCYRERRTFDSIKSRRARTILD